MGVKKIVRKILGYDDVKIVNSSFDRKNFSKSLDYFVENNPDTLSSFRKLGKRRDNKPFSEDAFKIDDGYNLLFKDLSIYDNNGVPKIDEYFSVRNGNPLRMRPFPLCITSIMRVLFTRFLYVYPTSIGERKCRQKVVNYLRREGFSTESSSNYDGIGIDNVAFTYSTTHAYNLIINTIARNEDVIIVTGPNYGIFAVNTEVCNARLRLIELREEDDFLINPELLGKRIDEINLELKNKFKGRLDYTPRVVAFLNLNPHNPLGKVLSKKNMDIITRLGDVCLEKGVFIIDDLIYRDLTYDQDNLAFPIASIPKYFNNTITISGLSKSYSLAGIRAGFILAPVCIVRGLEDYIFSDFDSYSVLQSYALAGAFNDSNKRYRLAKKYFGKAIKEYKYRLALLEALIYGIDYKNCQQYKKIIIRDIKKYTKDEDSLKLLFSGIPGVCIRNNTYPQSGFFALVDFTKLIGKRYGNNVIKNDADFLTYLYQKTKINCLMGLNFSWPYPEEIVGRFNFAIEKRDLIHNLYLINRAVRGLK